MTLSTNVRTFAATMGARLGVALGVAVLFLAGPALAQIQPPEAYQTIDRFGVNLASGRVQGPPHTISIGQPGQGGLSATFNLEEDGKWRNSLMGGLTRTPLYDIPNPDPYVPVYIASIMGSAPATYLQDTVTGEFIPEEGTGTLVAGGPGYIYTALDGTVAVIDYNQRTQTPYNGRFGQVTSITRPNGEVITFHYTTVATGQIPLYARRLQSVTNNFGYQVHLEYRSEAWSTAWGEVAKVTAFNNTVDWCAPTATSCTFSQTWPSLTFGHPAVGEQTVTDATNNVTRYFFAGSGLTGIRRPGQTSGQSITYSYNTPYPYTTRVSSASDGVGTWTYGYSQPPPNVQVTYSTSTWVTDPLNNQTELSFYHMIELPEGRTITRLAWVDDPYNNRTSYQFGDRAMLTQVTHPEGNREWVSYTDRGDIAAVGRTDKTGNVHLWTAAAYADCSTPILCGRPTSITDARQNTTNYTYYAHGGVQTETRPAPTPGAARPQTRYNYQQLSAWYRTSASTSQVQAPAVWRPTGTSACVTGTSCAGTAQEVISTTGYQAGSAGVGSNLLPVTSSIGSGDGLLTATTTTTWTANGDQLLLDGPLAGTVDVTWSTYDAMRRSLGSIGPDPDDSGALGYPASRTTYTPDGKVASVERGTTTGQSEAAFSAFTSLQRTDILYDALGRQVRESEFVGAGLVSITDYSYDVASRPLCTAVRMNPAAFGSLPGACTLSTPGPDGPDRISHNTYDNASRLTVVRSGFGTPLVQATRSQGWTANGKIDWIEDANGNRSNYDYDPFDRMHRLEFPVTTVGAHAANPADYEAYGFDANDNVISERVRSGETISYTYDALNRQTSKITPTSGTADDVFYAYDNLGRRLSASFDGLGSSNAVTWTWDALGRQLTETSYGRTLTSQYDLAGRRTKLYWPGTDYIEFVHDRANRIIQLRENGVYTGPQLLAFYVYDNLGRRDYLARGNGAPTDWNYVANSRDWSVTQNLAGTGQDLVQAFALNPAGQIRQRDLSNSIYSYIQPTVAQTYARDGLNRYTSVGGAAFGYDDGRGNLTADGARNYTYDLENRLLTVSGGSAMTLSYDPLGRLRQTVSGGTTTQFLYDGDRLVAEYNGAGTLTARYAHGPGKDEPLVWYEGSSLTDRRWLHADAQGSIIATSGSTGAILGQTYRYSPYGEPDTDYGFSGGSRFRYTGQITLRGAPLWHYKARAYDPGIGRFLQTDPVGYAEGLNLYSYVSNDPLNHNDPTGLYRCPPGPNVDCAKFREAQQRAIREFRRNRARINEARRELRRAGGDESKLSTAAKETLAEFRQSFGNFSNMDVALRRVAAGYTGAINGLRGNGISIATFSDGRSGWGGESQRNMGYISIDYVDFNSGSPAFQSYLVGHEALHGDGGIGERGAYIYHTGPSPRSLARTDPNAALDNADNYYCFGTTNNARCN